MYVYIYVYLCIYICIVCKNCYSPVVKCYSVLFQTTFFWRRCLQSEFETSLGYILRLLCPFPKWKQDWRMQLKWWSACSECMGLTSSASSNPGVVAHICKPSTWEMKSGRSEVQGCIGTSRSDLDTRDSVATQEQQNKTKMNRIANLFWQEAYFDRIEVSLHVCWQQETLQLIPLCKRAN